MFTALLYNKTRNRASHGRLDIKEIGMETKVEFAGKRSFKVKTRDHEIITDLPEKGGGDNKASTPTELFIASIGACIGLYVARYLETAKLDPKGLSVGLDWWFDEGKTRVGQIDISICAPNAVLGHRKRAVIAAAQKCVIHKTLHDNPDLRIRVEGE